MRRTHRGKTDAKRRLRVKPKRPNFSLREVVQEKTGGKKKESEKPLKPERQEKFATRKKNEYGNPYLFKIRRPP